MKVSFNQSGRTGNLLFQYISCKLITLLYGHEYIPIQDLKDSLEQSINESLKFSECNVEKLNNLKKNNVITIEENDFENILDNLPSQSTENWSSSTLRSEEDLKNTNIILNGYFQKSKYFVPYREKLINMILNENNNDYWIKNNEKIYVKNLLFTTKHSIENLDKNDIVLNLRLDDFIQMPNPKSDILPPQYYLNILESLLSEFAKKSIFPKIYIVCDRIHHDWEYRYLKFFDKYSPILIQQSLEHDIALMRDANILIHSNSTLCWLSSFFSTLSNKRRFIPKTFHYSSQDLNKINKETDVLFLVKTLEHQEVFNINYEDYNKSFIHPLSYCIPDDCIITNEEHEFILKENKKVKLTSELIPNGERQYKFGFNEEKEYNQQYRDSWFAYTQKKGGWDCLRHYEIMANGCIPIFNNLEHCPIHTLTSFPKELILEANKLRNFLERSVKEDQFAIDCEEKSKIQEYSKLILNYVREHCSTSAASKYFIDTLKKHNLYNLDKYYLNDSSQLDVEENIKYNKNIFCFGENLRNFSVRSVEEDQFAVDCKGKPVFQKKKINILLVRCNIGVNYTRELLWIGLKNYFSFSSQDIKSTLCTDESLFEKGVFVEYPKIDYLYKSFPEEKKRNIYGNGFTYSKKIDDDFNIFGEEIIKKTKDGFWDLVIFGKVGPDEGHEGTIPQMPLWEHVFKLYTKEQIIFLYGGDECINLKYDNRYKQHIQTHSQYGHCFVRELEM